MLIAKKLHADSWVGYIAEWRQYRMGEYNEIKLYDRRAAMMNYTNRLGLK